MALIIENVLCMSIILFSDRSVSESSDFSGLSKVYEDTYK